MLSLRFAPAVLTRWWEGDQLNHTNKHAVVCATKGPRPRFPRVWKTKRKIGTLSKSIKLVQSIKELSNVKEEVYGALDSFIAWELDFPLITVKKALKTLEDEKEWKRVIQVTKWMLSKGQGRTMGSYYMLLNALAEDGRLEEVEELWTKLFSDKMDSMPRIFFEKMVSVYYHREMHENMFEIFGDMEELGIKPTVQVVKMMGAVLQKLGMMDKYQKLNKKYPPPKWVYKYVDGKRIKVKATDAVSSRDRERLNDYNKVNNDSVKETESDESDGDDSVDHDLYQAAESAEPVR